MFDFDLPFLDFLEKEPYQQWFSLVIPHERLFIAYLLSSLALAFIAYLAFRSSTALEKPDTSKGFWQFVFGGEAYTHKSAVQDYVFFLTNAVAYYFFAAQFLLSNHVFSLSTYQLAETIFGPLNTPLLDSTATKIGYTLVALLLGDFAVYLSHYLTHKNGILWHFHKVHHSAEVLNPVTLHRMHPVDLLLNALIAALLVGLATGGFFYLSGDAPGQYEVMGINIAVFLFYIIGYNLRHSQVWLSWGKKLSYIFISPAQHQIHHSTAPRHMDKNFGLIFSFWDHLFGTLYVPEKYEKIEYGIKKSEKNPFNSVWELYVMPFVWSFKDIRSGKSDGFFTIVSVVVILSVFMWWIHAMIMKEQLRSVHIEDLTWTEIWGAQYKGYDAIIIPTGGTEQNGAHVVTGKHNYIVRYTAGEIAEHDGLTLVAPVIGYVPEGPHMEYPGTIDLPENVLTEVLVAAGDSFLQHGFRYVFFLGDSYGNQDSQRNAADILMKKWADKGIYAASLDKYYDDNHQKEYLKKKGFTESDIGGHAALRDTSELMAVHPEGVRAKSEQRYPELSGLHIGNNGNIEKANRKIGENMLKLKISTALEQLRQIRKDHPLEAPAPIQKKEPEKPMDSIPLNAG